ncbi:integrase core domain-containing protein [Lentzea sp. NPDC003310]|uniref:integrase core domain-containing protein n=1 Tax=Lentzea sp. NPDC003310 TaxID=3154447 RepID=UPI0033A1C460
MVCDVPHSRDCRQWDPEYPRSTQGSAAPGSIRRETLDHVLVTGEGHARHVIAAYQTHYNEHRPHQARDQRVPICSLRCSDDFSCGTRSERAGPLRQGPCRRRYRLDHDR